MPYMSSGIHPPAGAWDPPAALLKALGHPVRLQIVAGLACGGCNVGRIWNCLNLPQPTVSQHLKVLRQEGILEAERHGKEIVYRLRDPRVPDLLAALGVECRPLRS